MTTPTALNEFKQKLKQFESEGKQALGVHLPTEIAKQIQWELTQMYGSDQGGELPSIYGIEVMSLDADEIRFEE